MLLAEEKLDALLISSSYNIRYLTGFDGFGTHEREGFALITNKNLYIFADPRASEGARNHSINTTVIEFGAGKRLLPQIQELIEQEKLSIIGFEENLTYSEYKRFKKLKNVKFKLTEEIVEEIRVIKDIDEIKTLQEACKLSDDAFSYVLKNMRINMSEDEVAWIIEKYIREHGGELAFPTIAAFGKHSAVPHHKTGNQKLKANDIVLLDFGAKVNGYHSDMTRTVIFGTATDTFKKMYEAVRIGQEKAFTPPTLTPEAIDKTAREHIISLKYPSVPHSVGHGVGLEVHELPHITPGYKDLLLPNTPFTIEPGIYVNDFGGARIEDTVWFDGEKISALTKSPKNLIEVS